MRAMDKFEALADPTRRRIVEMLSTRGQLSATEIAGHFQSSAPAISQHLKILREAELVLMEKRAQQRIYRVNPEALSEFERWVQNLRTRWEERFSALDQVLEAEKRKCAVNPNDRGERVGGDQRLSDAG